MSGLLAQGHKIKRFTSDGICYKDLELFLNLHGIKFIPTHLYTPEENSLKEKMNGVLVGKMRAAILAADLPQKLWPEVLQYFVDSVNMNATVRGSVEFVFTRKPKYDNKLSPKAELALLLGFARRSPGYILLHLRTGKIVETRVVKFGEDITMSKKNMNSL
ncbi:LOW QUALITY PROTEIN: hypothetical protein PHMEG_0007634 [Phytophthora megakarya]|uniref:Retroviral polymerase SH3-like domain-containing protein n=1 Tax=Phytophthora megakarya TaxID=4795 RepID=A0A225WLJ4_9STRA|nr:LOW QUALITY PROTEIN: hypothetical protein PHMEG_0007634 [Phytophthora megakarya]